MCFVPHAHLCRCELSTSADTVKINSSAETSTSGGHRIARPNAVKYTPHSSMWITRYIQNVEIFVSLQGSFDFDSGDVCLFRHISTLVLRKWAQQNKCGKTWRTFHMISMRVSKACGKSWFLDKFGGKWKCVKIEWHTKLGIHLSCADVAIPKFKVISTTQRVQLCSHSDQLEQQSVHFCSRSCHLVRYRTLGCVRASPRFAGVHWKRHKHYSHHNTMSYKLKNVPKCILVCSLLERISICRFSYYYTLDLSVGKKCHLAASQHNVFKCIVWANISFVSLRSIFWAHYV